MSEPTRLELLKAGYAEVLDATKHQDDKIGRMLTAVAFVLAGSFALAGIGSGRTLSQDFSLYGDDQPRLVLICLVGFEVCVVGAGLLLIFGLATPLTMPGVDSRTRGQKIEQAPSQIYFISIARLTRKEWVKRWSSTSDTKLRREADSMYVDEIYNLAVRTNAKNNRANEAVAVLSLGFLGLACAVPLVLSSASHGCAVLASAERGANCVDRLPVSGPLLAALAAILGLYTFAIQLSRIRAGQVNTEDLSKLLKSEDRVGVRVLFARIQAVLLTGIAVAPLLLDPRGNSHTRLTVLYSCVAVIVLLLSASTLLRKRSETRKHLKWMPYRVKLQPRTGTNAFITMSSACISAICVLLTTSPRHSAAWLLLAAVAVPIGLSSAALLEPSASTAERLRKAKARTA